MANSSSSGTSWKKRNCMWPAVAVPDDALLLLRCSAEEGSIRNRPKQYRACLPLQTTHFPPKTESRNN